MHLQAIHCETPRRSYSQADCLDILKESRAYRGLKDRSRTLLEKVLTGPAGIERRYFAMPDVEGLFDLDAEALNRGFEREGPELAGSVLRTALAKADLRADQLDGLLVCTCTGYICPGISSYVAERLGVRSDAFLSDIVGLGCGAAIPLLRQAQALTAARPGSRIACVAVEICSAAFYLDDDPGVLISLCLFGDGAAASIWSSEGDEDQIVCDGFDTIHLPSDRDLLRFENSGGKLRNRLHRSVPEKAAEAVGTLFERGNREGEAVDVLSHAGGRDVLDEICRRLVLDDLPFSRQVLRDCGNMSSPSVLFALDSYLREKNGEAFNAWATAFGAGFAAHSCRFSRG